MSTGPLKVGVNLLWLVPGVVGGTEQAAIGFLSELAGHGAPDIDPTLFALEPFAAAHPDLATSLATVVLPYHGHVRPLRVAAEATWLNYEAHRAGVEVIHNYGGLTPFGQRVPSVLTVHDVQPLVHPERFSPLKRRWIQTMLPRSVDAARIVLTPSEFARRSLLEALPVDPAKVRVVPHGLPLRDRGAPTAETMARVRRTYRLDGPTILYPAITYVHKNHLTLVRAFAKVAATHPAATLVLTGGAAEAEADVLAEVERCGVGGQVRRVGRIPRGDLDVLMHVADLLAFPSRYEGFGLPLLDAMADGCPIVAADAAAAPDVVGDAGVLLDPDDVDAWSDTIALLVDDEEQRRVLIARGHARVGMFSWRHLVPLVAAAYREAAGRSPLAEPETEAGAGL